MCHDLLYAVVCCLCLFCHWLVTIIYLLVHVGLFVDTWVSHSHETKDHSGSGKWDDPKLQYVLRLCMVCENEKKW
jgi:hypothetical protein